MTLVFNRWNALILCDLLSGLKRFGTHLDPERTRHALKKGRYKRLCTAKAASPGIALISMKKG